MMMSAKEKEFRCELSALMNKMGINFLTRLVYFMKGLRLWL